MVITTTCSDSRDQLYFKELRRCCFVEDISYVDTSSANTSRNKMSVVISYNC